MGNPCVMLGDQLDTKAVIDGWALNHLYKHLSESKLHWILIVGNHDYFVLDECQDHSMEVLKALPNVTVVDSPTQIGGMWFLPYYHDKEKLRDELFKIPKGSVVFGHFEISGFDYGNGHVCDDGVPETSFLKFKRVISGHFHKFQQKGNLTYIGTAFSKDFGESNQDKYIGVYRQATDELLLTQTQFPKHRTIEVDLSKGEASAIMEWEKDDEVRVVLKGTAEQIAAFPRLENVRYDEKPSEEAVVLVAESDNHMDQFRSWAEYRKVPDPTVALGLKLMKEVSK